MTRLTGISGNEENLLHQDLNLPPSTIENPSHVCGMCGMKAGI